MPRKHTLLTIPGIRSNRPRIKKRCQNLPRETKLIASKKLTFDWLAQKFRRRFHVNPTVSGISEHQSDEFLRERFKSYDFQDFPRVFRTPPVYTSLYQDSMCDI